MIAQLLYRDAGNYKTVIGSIVPKNLLGRIKVGSEFQIEEFGRSEDWLHSQTGNDYDPELDHNMVEVEALYDTWEDFLKENPDYKEKPVAPVMPVEVVEQELIDEVIEEIKKDISIGDYTVLDELLHFIPRQNLVQSLSEERWKAYETQIKKEETRYYMVNPDELEEETDINNMSDEEFIEEAERQGTVYSQEGFQEGFNNDDFGSFSYFLRILKL